MILSEYWYFVTELLSRGVQQAHRNVYFLIGDFTWQINIESNKHNLTTFFINVEFRQQCSHHFQKLEGPKYSNSSWIVFQSELLKREMFCLLMRCPPLLQTLELSFKGLLSHIVFLLTSGNLFLGFVVVPLLFWRQQVITYLMFVTGATVGVSVNISC